MREALIELARRARTTPDRLSLIRIMTRMSDQDIASISELFKYRNSVVHARVTPFEGRQLDFETSEAIDAAGRGDELEVAVSAIMLSDDSGPLEGLLADFDVQPRRTLNLPMISTEDLEAAPGNLEIAERVVAVLRKELDSGWPAE
jgi:hypothetical protein